MKECPDTIAMREEYRRKKQIEKAAPNLLAALELYVKLDNDRRAGCEITPEDWAECHQAAITAIAKIRGTC